MRDNSPHRLAPRFDRGHRFPMGQALRIEYPCARFHVVARATFQRMLFADDADRRRFFRRLHVVTRRYEWRISAYCLMGTHYHLMLETPRPNLALGIQALNSVYARGFNRRHGGHGHVFSERYEPTLILSDSHLLEVHRYVVLNPVRAGVCAHPADHRWSSYRASAGLGAVPGLLDVGAVLSLLAEDPRRARARYRAFVEDGLRSIPAPSRERAKPSRAAAA
jgi:putative transposase